MFSSRSIYGFRHLGAICPYLTIPQLDYRVVVGAIRASMAGVYRLFGQRFIEVWSGLRCSIC